MTYTYVLRTADGTTFTVSGIVEPPSVYAGMAAAAGLTIVSYTSQQGGGSFDYPIYRLILETNPGRVDTGGTYPGCLPRGDAGQVALCDPQQFATIEAAFVYAEGRGEVPVIVQSAEEGFQIAENEERARQLQQQYTGPSASPLPGPGPSPVPTPTGGLLDQYGAYILAALGIWMLAKAR